MRSRKSVKVRRDHKDTLFRMIFSMRENLLSLYNAVNRSHYTDAEKQIAEETGLGLDEVDMILKQFKA